VAGIVKLDDAGLYLSRQAGRLSRAVGAAILKAAPYLMKGLSIAGTAAMFLVGGGILTHGLEVLHHWSEALARAAAAVTGIGRVLQALAPLAFDVVAGIVVGAMVLGVVSLSQRVVRSIRAGQ
jgi:predicted DNA repair protein MutK